MDWKWVRGEGDFNSPAQRLWLASSRRSSPPLQDKWRNKQVAETTWISSLPLPLFPPSSSPLFTESQVPQSQSSRLWSEATERKGSQRSKKRREVSVSWAATASLRAVQGFRQAGRRGQVRALQKVNRWPCHLCLVLV